ncbi:MAG: hypothetical protein HY897_00145 [Deltaproteobacteria bacterium]|nr:hypothetical protein [Deltaproteobacteria bacterium]
MEKSTRLLVCALAGLFAFWASDCTGGGGEEIADDGGKWDGNGANEADAGGEDAETTDAGPVSDAGGDGDAAQPADGGAQLDYTYRAIAGFSMGGLSAAMLGLKHEELFDVVAPLGTFLDGTDFLRFFSEAMFGGFCVPPESGKMCPSPWAGEDYEHMDLGDSSSGTTHRWSFVKVAQDAAAIAGNPFLYNPASPYLPPGVGPDYLGQDAAGRCANPRVVPGLFDARFNPKGEFDAITFCDGDGPEMGVFDQDGPHEFPLDILLAIDLNGNRVRDSGEPIVIQYGEPWSDVGSWPDDVFHPLTNPFGTVGNGRWDPGEPFEDVGLDGVPGTGDFGEGNGVYDSNPNHARLWELDPRRLLTKAKDLDRLRFYIDVGIRDHIRNMEMTETFAGTLMALGQEVGIYEGFDALGAGSGKQYEPARVAWGTLSANVLVKYGNPAASASEIEAGDGGHSGGLDGLIKRFMTMAFFVANRFPRGDMRRAPNDYGHVVKESFHSPVLSDNREYHIFLPPAYEENMDERYPVLFMLGGHGMEPGDLSGPVALFLGVEMSEGRLQKMLVVFPDARCYHGECAEAAAYANMVGRFGDGPQYEDSFVLDLIPHIDAVYRTKATGPGDTAP